MADTRMPSIRSFAWMSAVLTVIAVTLAGVGVGSLGFNGHYSAYFDQDDQRLREHESIARTYSRHDSLVIVLHNGEELITSPESYLRVSALSGALARLPTATAVISIADLDILGNTELDDGTFIPDADQLLGNDFARGLLISDDLTHTCIRVEFDVAGQSTDVILELLADVRSLVGTHLEGSAMTAHFSGTLALNEAYVDVVRRDLATVMPLLLLTICALLAWLLGSVRALVSVLPVGMLSLAAAFGLAGLRSTELAAINAFIPVIILTISVAACVHMSLSFNHYRVQGRTPEEAALDAIRFNALPMALANGTTATGFLLLLLSPSPPVRAVGFMVATGVLMSFLLCMTLLPWLQSVLDPVNRRQRTFGIGQLAAWSHGKRRLLMIAFAALALPAGWLSATNVVSDNVLQYFPPDHTFHIDTEIVDRNLSGINEVLYSLDFGVADALFSEAAVEKIQRLADWLRQQPEVRKLVSIADHPAIVEASAGNRLQDRLSYYRDLADKNDARNPLLAREVSADYSSSLLSVYLQDLDSARLVAFDRRVRDWIAQNHQGISIQAGGPSLMMAWLGENNIRSMLAAMFAALILAALILGVVTRSARAAITGLLCNIIPIALVYSLWSLFSGQISLGAAIVMGMIVGIVIDDTIFLLSTWHRRRVEGAEDATTAAMTRVGPALIITTIALVAGLGVGLASEFGPVWSMSILSTSIIGVALLTDLTLLPAMLSSRGRAARA